MVIANPPLAEPATDPGGVINKPPFEMGVANLVSLNMRGLYCFLWSRNSFLKR